MTTAIDRDPARVRRSQTFRRVFIISAGSATTRGFDRDDQSCAGGTSGVGFVRADEAGGWGSSDRTSPLRRSVLNVES